MKYKIICIVILLAVGQGSTPSFIGETLHYSAGFRFFPAGNATLSMETDSLEDKMIYLLTSTVTTNSSIVAKSNNSNLQRFT